MHLKPSFRTLRPTQQPDPHLVCLKRGLIGDSVDDIVALVAIHDPQTEVRDVKRIPPPSSAQPPSVFFFLR